MGVHVRWRVRSPQRAGKIALALLAVGMTSVFFIDLCDWIYSCGCRSLWNGAEMHCNIHTAGVKHCPWCAIGTLGAGSIWAAIAGVQTWVALRPDKGGWVRRIVLTFSLFPIMGGLIGAVVGIASGYWAA